MTTPAYYTLNGDIPNGVNPYRPGVGDLGGAAKEDDQQFPPDKATMLCADDVNQGENLLAGLARVAPLARLYVKFSGGTPSLYAVLAMGSLLTVSDFTITDLGIGITKITCPGTWIPAPTFPGGLTLISTSDCRGTVVLTGGADGLVVYTRNSAGAAADIDFTVEWV